MEIEISIEKFKFINPKWIWTIVIGVYFIIPILAYLPALDAGFYFDDLSNIIRPEGIHWESISISNVIDTIKYTNIPRRIVANLSFALNYTFGRLNPKGYHLINILIHLAVGLALSWVIFLLTVHKSKLKIKPNERFTISMGISLLFLLHPLNIQAVTYIVQRMSSLSTFFFLMAMGSYIFARNRATKQHKTPLYLLSVILWLLALGCKETAIMLPAVIILYEFCYHRSEFIEKLRKKIQDRTIWKWLVISVLLLALLLAYATPRFHWSQNFPQREFNGYQRVLTQARVQLFYISLILWPAPSRLNLDHDFLLSTSLFKPWTTFPALTFWFILFGLSVFLVWKKPGYGFPMLMYFILHAIESGPIGLELIFEHRMYLPMTALAILAANGILDLKPSTRKIAVVLTIFLSIPLALATYARNKTWSDPVVFHYDCARKSPNKWRPQYNLGTILENHGLYAKAISAFKKAIEIDPDKFEAYYNLGTTLGKMARYTDAIDAINKALEINPEFSESHNQLGNCYLGLGMPDKALEEYIKAVEVNPKNAEANYNLAIAYDNRREYDKAIIYYKQFLNVAPPHLESYRKKVRLRLASLVNNNG